MSTIEHLFVSSGHNYFGHHGAPPGTHAIIEVDAIECIAERGITGDRFFDYKPGYKGQITFFAMETFEAMCAALQIGQIAPSTVRRNVFTRGLDLRMLVGSQFEIQGVRFYGMEECRPCYWMDRAVGPGAESWLQGRGGLRARILSTGQLRVSTQETQQTEARATTAILSEHPQSLD